MTTNKNIKYFTAIIIFFLTIINNYAQEGEYFINPDRIINGITIKRGADFSKYEYEYTILDQLDNPRIHKRGIINTSAVRERFITSLAELALFDRDTIIIPFTGMEADRSKNLPDGLYKIWLYETNKNNKNEINSYLYLVNVDTRPPIFNIQLISNTIYVKNRQSLICRTIPVSEKASEWNVKIQKEGNNIKEQSFKYDDNEIDFPGFSWIDYEDFDYEDQYFTIIVEGIDRTGNKTTRTKDFVLTNREITNTPIIITQIIENHETVNNENDNLSLPKIETHETTNTIYVPKGNFILRPEDYEIYNVKDGDYLAKIAREYYGSATLWGLIYEINKKRLPNEWNPNLILPGLELILPSKQLISDLIEATKESQKQIE